MKENRQIPDDFSKAMEFYRHKRGLSYKELSEKSGISQAYLCRIINKIRKAPSVPIAVSICKCLEIPKHHILALFDLDDVDECDPTDLYEFILFNEITVDGEIISSDARETMADVIQVIVKCEWSKNTIANDVMLLAQKIEEFKERFNN